MRISDWSSDVCSSDLHRLTRRHVGDHAVRVVGDVAAQPGEVAARHRRAGHHQEGGLGEARDGEVGLDAAAVVQPLGVDDAARRHKSEEHTSELQSLMRISYAVFCLKKKKKQNKNE